MREIRAAGAPEPVGPYSQAVASGDLVICSGQLGMDPSNGKLRDGVGEQTRQALVNLGTVLKAAGTDMSSAIKVTVFLTDLSCWQEVNHIYSEFFSPPFPARSVVQAAALPKGALVEIELMARR